MKYFILFNVFLCFYKINKYHIEDHNFSNVSYQKGKELFKLNLKHLSCSIEIKNREQRILYDLSRKRRRNRKRKGKRKGFGRLWRRKNKNKRKSRREARRRKRERKRAERKRKKKQKKQLKKEKKRMRKQEREKKRLEGQSNELIKQEGEIKKTEPIVTNQNGNNTLNNNSLNSNLANNEGIENEEEEDNVNKYNGNLDRHGENQKYNYPTQSNEQKNIPKSINSPYYKEIDSNIKIVNVAKLEHESKHEIIDKIKKALEVLQ
ncbi:hypothetical protein YYG_04536 [Plasmodium vinckei petteri]|uniref:Uncharacterized protein n=1 Tax=Plasmodium vinckei petteri TaxID=138298 RepID=W7AET5_PLAVN|nr:hypothetical protein YYG_04536 [Plasmodium vinckei petteri]CAD2096102.1 conserved Plasmodium protein, unknown function [Plasmodium vinckei petteri]